MTISQAINIIESSDFDDEGVEDARTQAFQYLINTRVVWQLQGWYGREATRLINSGLCVRRTEGVV